MTDSKWAARHVQSRGRAWVQPTWLWNSPSVHGEFNTDGPEPLEWMGGLPRGREMCMSSSWPPKVAGGPRVTQVELVTGSTACKGSERNEKMKQMKQMKHMKN